MHLLGQEDKNMSRESTDELAADGSILNGFDYRLQVWVRDGVVLNVGMGAAQYAGQRVNMIPGHDVRDTARGIN